MKKLLLIVFGLSTTMAFSQLKDANKTSSVSFSAGHSTASTGDIPGFYISTGVQKTIKRWSFGIDLLTTIHDGYNPLYFETSPGRLNDGSIRYSTAGIQLAFIPSYKIIAQPKHQFKLGIGAVLRYQSSSYYDSYEILYPGRTGLDFPVMYFSNREPMRTFAVGPIGQIAYEYKFSKKMFLGINGSFQFDSNGDNFTNYGLRIGHYF